MPPDPKELKPGVLDGAARIAFRTGACAALALALHDATGWPIVAVTDHHNVTDRKAGGGSAMHYAVQRPDGKLVDVDGLHEAEVLTREYDDYADDGKAAWGTTTKRDVRDWYVEAQGEPIPVRLAKTFVKPVLAKVEQQERATETTSMKNMKLCIIDDDGTTVEVAARTGPSGEVVFVAQDRRIFTHTPNAQGREGWAGIQVWEPQRRAQ